MENSGGATAPNWTETVEDLVYQGEVDKAISFLESIAVSLEKELEKEQVPNKNCGNSNSSFSTADQFSTVLHDLSKLYSAEGFSLKADRTLSRAIQIKHRKGGLCIENQSISDELADAKNDDTSPAGGIASHEGYDGSSSNLNSDGFPQESCADDDWEAMADRAPEELLPPQSLPGVSKLSLEDKQGQSIKRRGRGTFSYKKHGLYSDSHSNEPFIDGDKSEDNTSVDHADEDQPKRNLIYGTRHVLVLADMPLSTNTSYLEKLMQKFKDTFVIRWVNDTTALAVFRTPSIALEAINSVQWPFTVRILSEDDELLDSIPPKELEPPRQRPKTSARAAQRLIANSMGIKLPSTSFGSTELRKQEEARKNRILSRQNMRDDAWGDDHDNQDQKPK